MKNDAVATATVLANLPPQEAAALKQERLKFGAGAALYQSEEIGLGGIPTAIIQSLGGGSVQLGIFGAKDGIGPLFSWLGALFLRRHHSNRNAMLFAMKLGGAVALVLAAVIIAFSGTSLARFGLYAYLALALAFMAVNHARWTIETNWTGDLVPRNLIGWFTKMRWVITVFGLAFFSLFFGFICDHYKSAWGYASVYIIFGLSSFAAMLIYRTIRDVVPKQLHLIKKADSEGGRLQYGSVPLWNYTIFLSLWFGGRFAFSTFTSAYLIEHFHCNLMKIAAIYLSTWFINIAAIALIGRVTDRLGHRLPLIIAVLGVGMAMQLLVVSAWWGLVPVVLYYILNGFAGNTTAFLYTNYALELFPEKGRAEYISFCRMVAGLVTIAFTVLAGLFMKFTQEWSFGVGNVVFNHYHLLFFLTAGASALSGLFLILNGKRTVS